LIAVAFFLAGSLATWAQQPTKTPAESPTSEWFETTQGGFKARYPTSFPRPIKQVRSGVNDAVQITSYLSISATSSINVLYGEDPIDATDLTDLLKQARDQDLKSLGAVLDSETPGNFKGIPSLEKFAHLQVPRLKRFLRIRYVFTKHRWFSVVFTSFNEDQRQSKEVTAFFESFEPLPFTALKDEDPSKAPTLQFSNPDLGISASLPSGFSPPIDQSALMKANGALDTTQFFSTGPTGVVLFQTQNDKRINTRAIIQEASRGAVDGFTNAPKVENVEKRPFQKQGRAGTEIRFKGDAGGQPVYCRAVIFGSKGRIRVMLFMGFTPEARDWAEIEALFSSLRLDK
jgi:hypothetical protein